MPRRFLRRQPPRLRRLAPARRPACPCAAAAHAEKRFGNPDVAKAVANLVWLGLERLTQIGVAIAISGLLARYFGPDVFGKWQYANTLLLVLAPLTWVCGAEILVPTIVQRAARTRRGARQRVRAAHRRVGRRARRDLDRIGAGAFDPLVGAMLAGLAVTMVFREPFVGVINAWLQSMTYSKPQLVTSMVTALVKALLVWLLVRAAPARPFAWLWALEAAAIGFALLLYYRHRNGGTLGWTFDKPLFKHFATAGTVFWLGLICMYLFLKLDRLMLERTCRSPTSAAMRPPSSSTRTGSRSR
jgi:PST family polysaccharide transporter